MDDMNAFERQLAAKVVRMAGPDPHFNALEIARSAATQSPKWRFQTMFSATKFVVAGAIVALFGGFLLAGVLSQPGDEQMPAVGASPSATAEAEQAEPTTSADRSAGTFSSVESLAGAPTGTSTLLPDGRVLVVGDTRAEVWDPATGSRSPAGSMGTSRPNHSAVGLADGRVLIVSEDEYPASPSAEVWDPATESFSPAGSFSEWHSGLRPSLTLLPDGRVLVMGGGDHHMDATQVVEVWDPQTEAFRVAGEMIENRAEQTATLLQDGRVLVVGGEVEAGDPGDEICTVCDTPAALAEIWDPVAETFSSAGSLSEGRALHTATLLQDGRVLIIGGGDTYDHFVRSAEIWDPATETFSPAGSLREERIFHTATLLPDGRVLVAGGQTLSDLASGAEIWDPATMSFSPAGSLVRPRMWHAASLLPDGRVLVNGGAAMDRWLSGIELAEVWEPTTDESQASSDATAITPDLLPGVDLVTEEVEPGVYRVLSDGAGHDFADDAWQQKYLDTVYAAPDGNIWVTAFGWGPGIVDDDLIALGVPEGHGGADGYPGPGDLEIVSDGTLWARSYDRVASYDGDAWTTHRSDPELGYLDGIRWFIEEGVEGDLLLVQQDGTVWASGEGAAGPEAVILRLDADGWKGYGATDGLDGYVTQIIGTPDGEVWAVTDTGYHRFDPASQTWVRHDPDSSSGEVQPLKVGRDGGLLAIHAGGISRWDGATWVEQATWPAPPPIWGLVHWTVGHDDRVWLGNAGALYSFDQAVGGWSRHEQVTSVAEINVAPDGTIWVRRDPRWPTMTLGRDERSLPSKPDALLAFDGTKWTAYDVPRTVTDFDIAPDGTVWAISNPNATIGFEGDPLPGRVNYSQEDWSDIYVITPEAVVDQ